MAVWSMGHTEDPEILGVTGQNLVVWNLRTFAVAGTVHKQWHLILESQVCFRN